jgi:D-glycero-alpha-D-manno-heptose 1-phosphate guanylyltransferase
VHMPDTPDAIILCGGAGQRLRDVIGDVPKPMATVGGRPFLELLLTQLQRYGFSRVILAVGYRMGVIQSHFGSSALNMQVLYSPESSPLGTAGAVRKAATLVATDSVLIMNGDTYTDMDLRRLIADHHASNATVSLVAVPSGRRSDGGTIRVNATGRVVGFEEKRGGAAEGLYMNAGIYMMSRQALYDISPGNEASLEHEVFPRWLRQQIHLQAITGPYTCVDIGTPDRYSDAQRLLADTALQGCGWGMKKL